MFLNFLYWWSSSWSAADHHFHLWVKRTVGEMCNLLMKTQKLGSRKSKNVSSSQNPFKNSFYCLDIEIHWRILDLGKQKCFINYLKFKLTKKLEICDETINRVVWKILRPILLSNFKSCCCSPEFVPFHSIELGESRSTLQQGKYPY